jgi:hypothetical protein
MADVKSRSLQRVLALLAAVLTLSGAKAETGALNDPVAYCKATGTIDAPDAKYKGSAVPDWMVAKAYPPERDQGAERRRHESEEGDRLALRVGRRADVRARQCPAMRQGEHEQDSHQGDAELLRRRDAERRCDSALRDRARNSDDL